MKKNVIVIGAITLLFFSGCILLANKEHLNKTTIENFIVENSIHTKNITINQDILFIINYTNWADEYQCDGSFIDKNGYVYNYDFADESSEEFDENLLLSFIEETYPLEKFTTQILTQEQIKYLYALLYKINANEKFTETSVGCDMGQLTLYGVRYNANDSAELIKIYSEGDWIEEPQDLYAQRLYKYYNQITQNSLSYS